MSSASVRPFHFKSFGPEPEESPLPETVEEPPAPTFSEQEVGTAKGQAREEGFREGLESGLAQLERERALREQATSAAAAALAVQFDALIDRQQRFFDAQGPLLTQIALAAARRVAGHALRTEPTAEIEAMIERCLKELADEQPLRVAVHADILPLIEAAYEEKARLRPKDTQRLLFSADSKLGQLDDCRIEWPSGMLERNQADSWTRIELALAAFDPAAPEPVIPEPMISEPVIPEPAPQEPIIEATIEPPSAEENNN